LIAPERVAINDSTAQIGRSARDTMIGEARLSMPPERDEGTASRRRDRQRGVAPIEFAISLVILVPMVLGMIDMGYYFFVSVTAAEAARVGARNASTSSVGACSNTTAVSAASLTIRNAATGYMTQSGLTGITTTPTAACGSVTGWTGPAWTVGVQVDFRPLVGVARAWMKPSTVMACTGCVTFTQSIVVGGS
jgi:Flp pilus assembly protein TadG